MLLPLLFNAQNCLNVTSLLDRSRHLPGRQKVWTRCKSKRCGETICQPRGPQYSGHDDGGCSEIMLNYHQDLNCCDVHWQDLYNTNIAILYNMSNCVFYNTVELRSHSRNPRDHHDASKNTCARTCLDQFGALEYTKKCHSFIVLYGIFWLYLTNTMAYYIIWNIGVTVHMVSSFE